MSMNIWAISLNEATFTEDIFKRGLELVDAESQKRVRKYYHRVDAYRSLLSMLLPRILLKQHGVSEEEGQITRTKAGKPYFKSPRLERTIGFNCSHDSSLVVMGFQTCEPSTSQEHVDVQKVGADVMKIELPRSQTMHDFVDTISDTLTTLELQSILAPNVSTDEALRRLYLIWTLKEAYTKAIGFGLGFDFKRIEYDVLNNRLTVDRKVPVGWEIVCTELELGSDRYQVSTARYTGRKEHGTRVEFRTVQDAKWIKRFDAASLVKSFAAERK